MRVVFLSNHWWSSPRRAGFHHLASSFHRAGAEVTFATIGLSWISYARRDFRTRYKGLWAARNRLVQLEENFFSYVHFTPWHPHTLLSGLANSMSAPFMQRYAQFSLGALEHKICAADCIIYESSTALYLVERCKHLAPQAKHIYRVSDDIGVLRSTHPDMLQTEQRVAPLFDCISVPCRYLYDKFSGLSTTHLHFHGITKELFDAATQSPYTAKHNCVFVGSAYFDTNFLLHAARGVPHVQFHIIGAVSPKVRLPNVHYYGELPFSKTIPYVKFADMGLQTLRHSKGTISFTDTLKVLQYRYCGLPIISPSLLCLSREGVFYYTPDDAASCVQAVQQALAHGKHPAYAEEVCSWEQTRQSILAATGL